jgi:hypothetical protein
MIRIINVALKYTAEQRKKYLESKPIVNYTSITEFVQNNKEVVRLCYLRSQHIRQGVLQRKIKSSADIVKNETEIILDCAKISLKVFKYYYLFA